MSWRQPLHLFDLEMDDQVMMQEVLELLVMDSPSKSQDRTTSIATSSDHSNTQTSIETELTCSSAYESSTKESLSKEMQELVDISNANDMGPLDIWGHSLKDGVDGKKEAVQHSVEASQSFVQQTPMRMQDLLPSSLMLAYTASTRLPMSSNPTYATAQHFYAEDPQVALTALGMDLPILESVPSSESNMTSMSRSSSCAGPSTKSSSISHVLPTGQRVHLMNPIEFSELRRKLRMQTASRRYRKRKKEQVREQKKQIQDLQAELTRLHDDKAQWRQYQQRSIESLEKELHMHENEVAQLTDKVRDAAKEEVDWVEQFVALVSFVCGASMPTSTVVGRVSTPCGLREAHTASALQVAPSAVEFLAFECGSCYVATLNVRNASDRVVRFRLVPPTRASPFKVLRRGRDLARTENATVTLPSGLSTKYEITFEQLDTNANESVLVHDALQLHGDDKTFLEVPLLARRAGPLLQVSPTLCELGLVVLTQRSAQLLEVQNSGAKCGKFVIDVLDGGDAITSSESPQSSSASLTVSPQQGRLAPQQVVKVKVEALGLEIGAFQSILRLRILESRHDDDQENDEDLSTMNASAVCAEKIVAISGSVVEHTAELVLRQGLEQVTSLFFGSLFAGETRTIETLLRNNGPQPLLFKTSISFSGGITIEGSTAGVEDDTKRHKELRITPTNGSIEPFTEAVITFTYQPQAKTLDEVEKLVKSDVEEHDPEGGALSASPDAISTLSFSPALAQPLNAFASIICENLQTQNLTFEVSATTFVPRLHLSPMPPLDFGDVRSYDRVDMLMSLKNLSNLPIRFKATNKVAHYSMSPCTGRLDVLQSQSLVVSFAPTQLGTFASVLTLQINETVLELPIKVLGRAAVVGPVPRVSERIIGGPLALPADFAPKYKFLLPEEAKQTKGKWTRSFERRPAYEVAALNGTAALDDYELQGTNNTHLTYCVTELARRADHRAIYRDYLAQCRAQRELKGKDFNGKAQGLKNRVARARSSNQEHQSPTEDVELGMERLKPRQLKLPLSLMQAKDPLWQSQHPDTIQSKVFLDEFKLVKKKFKPSPGTPAEFADCSRLLDFDELEQVISGPKVLNFGRLSVNGSATRSLTVQNNLPLNVLVTLHFERESSGPIDEVARKTPLSSQVVPPMSKAGFDVVFCSSRELFFQQTISYSINNVHIRHVTIVAEVAPIVVEVAPSELSFDFGALDLSLSSTRDVVITNTCDAEASFAWTSLPLSATLDETCRPDSSKSTATTTVTTSSTMATKASSTNPSLMPVFDVIPAKGVLGPLATMLCKVMYTPPSKSGPTMAALGITQQSGALRLAQILHLDISGGLQGTLSCRALLPDVKVVARDKKVDFGTISIGLEREKRLTLANLHAHTRAVFHTSIEPPSMSTMANLQVLPSQGVIEPQTSTDLVVKLLPHRALTFDESIATESHLVHLVVTVRGGKVLRLPLKALVLVPEVHVTPSEAIEFGNVVLGVSVPRVLTFENRSAIPARLLLDLKASTFSDEFTLAIPHRFVSHLEDASSIFTPLLQDTDEHQAVNAKDDLEAAIKCFTWQILLPPHATVSCHLVFTPRHEATHDLLLPLQLAGMDARTSSSVSVPPLRRRVRAHALRPHLRFSSSTVHFQQCVITRQGIRKVPYTKHLLLTNDHVRPVQWQIDSKRLRQGNLVAFAATAASMGTKTASGGPTLAKRIASANPTSSANAVVFHVAPDQGELAPGEEIAVRVSFLPLDAVEYMEDELPLLVDGEPYVNLSLRGEGIHPHLSFSTNHVVLPTVPLGMTARASFYVHATGYDHLDLTCRLPLDTTRAPLTVHFPHGKTLSMACPNLLIDLCFSSPTSVAFNTRLEFLDADSNSFALLVSGCTENCILTNYAFLQINGLTRDVELDPSLCDTKELRRTSNESVNSKTSNVLNKGDEDAEKPDNEFQFYTHASGRYPIYLLSTRQAQEERAKHKETQRNSSHNDHNATATGFVVVESTSGNQEDARIDAQSNQRMVKAQAFGSEPLFTPGEIHFVLTYLNANFLQTPVDRFPEDFANTGGRPLYDLLEVVCGKKAEGLAIPSTRGSATRARKMKTAEATNKGNDAHVAGGHGASSSSHSSKKDLLKQHTTQFIELLRFLRSYGAMVHDVFPEHLLAQDLYLSACESPHADPALSSSISSTSLSFVARRQALMNEWRSISTAAWMKVLYQVIKCFVLSRITWKGYQMQLQDKEHDSSCHTKRLRGKHANVPTGRACQGSNIYSEAEMVLIQWLCDQVQSLHETQGSSATSMPSSRLETQLLDIERDLSDGRWLFHLVAAHIPTLCVDQSAYECFRWTPEATSSYAQETLSAAQLQHQANVLLQTLSAFGLDFGLDATRFLRHYTGREMLVLLLHLKHSLPQFIPKAKIEFRGEVGQVIEKKIELKNPSTRPLRYHVFLDGAKRHSTKGLETKTTASEFTIEANELVLEPGKATAFVVTLCARFSRTITARLVFQAVRGNVSGYSSMGASGATMVFLLASNMMARKPVRVIQVEAKTYEKRMEEIVIENQFPSNGTFKLVMTQQQTSTSVAETTAAIASSNAMTSALPSSRGGARRRVIEDKRAANTQQVAKKSDVEMRVDAATVKDKRESREGRKAGEDGEFLWCICSQQAFYLPDFGTSGSSTDTDYSTSGEGHGQGLHSRGTGACLAIRKNASVKLKLEFLPLLPGHYRCQLLFVDENLGEFLYEVHAVANLPASLETFEIQCEASTVATGAGATPRFYFVREVSIPPKNPLLTRALTMISDRVNGHLRTKLKDGLKRCEESHHTSYHVDLTSPYFTTKIPEVILTSSSSKAVVATGRKDVSPSDTLTPKGTAKATQARLDVPRSVVAGPNSLLLAFQPKGAGHFACKLYLRSQSPICGSIDLRVYDLIAKVNEPTVTTQLEFVAPARHSIVQEIPLSNPTEHSWSLKASFGNSNASTRSMFSGPSTLVVPPKRSVMYPLTFAPTWLHHETQTFVLVNTATQQEFKFALSGYGEEPLAQDHIVLNCEARTSITHDFDVFALPGGHEPNAAQVFKVESDLQNVVGASRITVPAGKANDCHRAVKYSLTFSPIVSGSYFGSITFTNESTNEYLWYTVEVAVSPREPEATLEMRASVRGAVGVEIGLVNPLDIETIFSVELRGRGLLGPTTLTLEPRQADVYELIYSPLLVTAGDEGAIVFSNDTIGQFWYRLNLVAEAATPQALDNMSCAVGDICTQPLWLENPSGQELRLHSRLTNTRNYTIKTSNSSTVSRDNPRLKSGITLPPFGRVYLTVEYTPSSLSDFESTDIVFYEEDVVSDWIFTVRGRGRAPSVMKPLVVTARVNEAASTLFLFKNPFAALLRVDIQLLADDSNASSSHEATSAFTMHLKKRCVVLESFGLLQVPISFLPRVVSGAHAKVVVRGQEEYAELEWTYPLQGVAEAPLHHRVLTVLACQARDSVEKRVECELLAAPDEMDFTSETFTVKWEINATRFGPMATAEAIERALTVTPLPVTSTTRSPFVLPYSIQFEPLRPYRGLIVLLVTKQSGGVWRFDVMLDVSEPQVDDVLSIESSLNQTSSVTFQLRNQFRHCAAFLAEFSPGSSNAFTVYPLEGELPPYGSDHGTAFVVSFTPTGYGKMQSGQLVICTEEMQWTFNVKGVYPDATHGSRSGGPMSTLSLSSSASRVRLGITKDRSKDQRTQGRNSQRK